MSNPFHTAQLAQDLSTGSYIVVNRSRKISTRGDILILFEPHDQVLADRFMIRTKSGANVISVKVACLKDGGAKEDIGFIDIFNGEAMTVGWNCLMEHAELRVPRIAS